MAANPTWNDMTDEEIEAAVREIIRTSKSDKTIKRRIADELGYSGEVAIHSTSEGSLRTVMLMMHGHDSVIEI